MTVTLPLARRLVHSDGRVLELRADPHIVETGVLTWGSQARQYPPRSEVEVDPETSIGYFTGDVSKWHPGKPPIDCLLLFGIMSKQLLGILNHYPVDYPPLEQAGNMLVLVHPDHRKHMLGTRLLNEAEARGWLTEDSWARQKYSAQGLAMAVGWLTRRGWMETTE